MESRRGFGGRVCGLLFFPRTMSNLFFGSVWTMAEICARVKMLRSNEQLHFCVTFLLWNKRFWVRSCPFDPSSVSKWSLYISAFYTSLSNPCDRNSVVTGGQRSWFNEVSYALNKQFCHFLLNYWAVSTYGDWPSLDIRVFRVVQALLQLFCFSFASGELCDEVINHCVPDLNPCQHESKCVPLDKGTR